MANYVMEHSGEELDEAIGYVLDNYKDVSPVTARAQDVVFGKIIVTPEGPVMGTYQGVVPPESWRKTAEGDPAVVTDGMAGWPLYNIEAEIRPVQDLRGYGHAWPAGGGKNKYPIAIGEDSFFDNGSATHSNSNGALVIVPNASSGASGVYINATAEIYKVFDEISTPFTVSFDIVSTASGTVRFTACGVNQTDTVGTTKTRLSRTVTSKTSTNFNIYGVNLGATLTITNLQIEEGSTASDYAPYSNICPISASESVTVTQNGSTAVSVEFPETPGTVYGGVMDFKTGVLTVTHRYRTLNGSERWAAWNSTSHSVRCAATDMKAQGSGDPASWLAEDGAACDSLPVVAENSGAPCIRFYTPTQRIYVYWAAAIDPSITSEATWMAWLGDHPINVVYPLAEPVTYQLAPQEMPLLAAGTNSFAADTGGVTVTYYSAPDDPTNPTVQSLQSSPAALSMAAPTADPMDEPEEVDDE